MQPIVNTDDVAVVDDDVVAVRDVVDCIVAAIVVDVVAIAVDQKRLLTTTETTMKLENLRIDSNGCC